MSYVPEAFGGAERERFLTAVKAEGVGLSPYIKQGLHREPWIDHILSQSLYKKMYGEERLRGYREQSGCPNCDRVCQEMAMVWASGPLLGSQEDMDDIVDAIFKVYEHRDELANI